MNERFGEKVKAIFDSITVLQAKDSDLKRDNANINGDSSMGAMLQYGANTAKEYNLEYLIKPAIAELHRDGWIHIHDLDFYAWTTTCTQIELQEWIQYRTRSSESTKKHRFVCCSGCYCHSVESK